MLSHCKMPPREATVVCHRCTRGELLFAVWPHRSCAIQENWEAKKTFVNTSRVQTLDRRASIPRPHLPASPAPAARVEVQARDLVPSRG